jgi:hypothetical protein
MAKVLLYQKIREWQESARDNRDHYAFLVLLNDLSFQADLRFSGYVQYQGDGSFLTRLDRWLQNLPSQPHQQALFRLLEHLIYVDDLQMTALYRDAYRRIIVPWIEDDHATVSGALAADYPSRQRRALAEYQIASVTESCNVGLLLKASDLDGVPRPFALGPSDENAAARVDQLPAGLKGCIVCEDVVGTGAQAGRILRVIERKTPAHWRILFVPLIIFEQGISNLARHLKRTEVKPVVVLPKRYCLTRDPQPQEPHVFKVVRGIVKNTASRVLERADEFDDPPDNPFGYEGSGGLIVTCHNSPNNTLPLVHHSAPTWHALFRRLHHRENKP